MPRDAKFPLYFTFSFLLTLLSCVPQKQHTVRDQEIDYDRLLKQINTIKIKQHLTDFNFDTEYIVGRGDLSYLLDKIVQSTLPELKLKVTEQVSADGEKYIATVSNSRTSMEIYADTNSDWLPDAFFQSLERLPTYFGSNKIYLAINPAIGLTGQDVWYFCGTEQSLKQARKEGLPLIFPGEDIFQTAEYKKYGMLKNK